MARIHPLAFVDPKAELAEDVIVGPFSYIEAGVVIGPGCVLESHVTIKRNTQMGRDNVVAQGAVLGGDPQDRKFSAESQTFLRIGDENTFREYVTVHRATGEGGFTTVGHRNYLMANVHLGHNVTLMDDITIANSTGLSGHVTVEELVTIGGMVGIHQFSRIGRAAMVGGMTRIVRDVPPYMLVEGQSQDVHDINAIGLRRLGVTPEARLALHRACKLLYKSQLGMTNAMEAVRREIPSTPEVEYVLAFEERRRLGKNGRGDQR